jgi:predicted DNA-binding transcriptional regulator AlpA
MQAEDQPYMAVAEVAAFLGITRQAAWNRSRRSGFPKPIAILRLGAVWATHDIVKFKATRRPRRVVGAAQGGCDDVFTLARARLAALGLPLSDVHIRDANSSVSSPDPSQRG